MRPVKPRNPGEPRLSPLRRTTPSRRSRTHFSALWTRSPGCATLCTMDAHRASIRTPDQRIRVFLSSTLRELEPEREAARAAIESLHLAPVMFELGARPHPPRSLYRAYLAQSDIFIGLYWQSYGWVGPGMDISGLEYEFRLSKSIPRLLYVKTPAPEREPPLTAMIAELQ